MASEGKKKRRRAEKKGRRNEGGAREIKRAKSGREGVRSQDVGQFRERIRG